MTVQDLILELATLDPNMEIVVPGAPYNQPNLLQYVGVVILKSEEPDTGVPAGEYIGLNMGTALDDDTAEDEVEEEIPVPNLSEEKEQDPPIKKSTEQDGNFSLGDSENLKIGQG